MGAKKKAAAEEGEDLSCEQFMKVYRKNCQMLENTIASKIIREKYETEYMEEGIPLSKVSFENKTHSHSFSSTFGSR